MSIIRHFFGRRSNVFDPFSLDVWDPFDGFPFKTNSWQLSVLFRPGEALSFANAFIDSKETLEAHVFKTDILGLKKEEIKVEVVDDRVLQISGERSHEESGETYYWVERSQGRFLRRFQLSENSKVDQVKAGMESGRSEQKKP